MSFLKKSTVGAKIWFLSAALLTNLVIVGGVSYWNSQKLTMQMNEVASVHLPAVRLMTLADMMHDGIRANVYAAIVTSGAKNEEEVKTVHEERDEFAKNIREHLAELKTLALPESTAKKIDAANPDVEAYVAAAHEITEIAFSGQVSKSMEQLPAFQEKFEALEKSLEVLGELIESDSQVAKKHGEELSANANRWGFALVMGGVLFGLVCAFGFIRTINKVLKELTAKVGDEADLVNSTAKNLEGMSDTLSGSVAKQASALQETASCMDEITAMVHKTEENSQNLEKTAKDTHESAQKGQAAMSDVMQAMSSIRESQSQIITQVDEGNQKIAEIVKVISEIGNKTKVINDIVFQTKLLSFNASVEAARAGEHGKGFSVVAEEVGNLAQMSGNAAKEISDMLASSVDRVENIVSENKRSVEALIAEGKEKLGHGSKVAEQCGQSLEEIVGQIERQTSMVNEISTALKEQNIGIQEISKAIQLLDKTTQENAGVSSETNTRAKELSKEAHELKSLVTELEAMVGGVKTPSVETAGLATLIEPAPAAVSDSEFKQAA